MLLRPDPPAGEMIPNGVSEGKIIIARSSDVPILDKSVMKVPVEVLLQRGNILHGCNPTDTDLLSFVMICAWVCRHFASFTAETTPANSGPNESGNSQPRSPYRVGNGS